MRSHGAVPFIEAGHAHWLALHCQIQSAFPHDRTSDVMPRQTVERTLSPRSHADPNGSSGRDDSMISEGYVMRLTDTSWCAQLWRSALR